MKHTQIWAFIAVMLFLPGIQTVAGTTMVEPFPHARGKFIPDIGELDIRLNSTLPGPRYCVTGNITVEAGATFILDGKEIYMNSSFSQRYSIFVKRGGALIVRNSTIQNFSAPGYSMRVEGRLEVVNSTISGLYYSIPVEKTGIQLLRANASIFRSVIRGSGLGVYLENSNLLLSGSVVECGIAGVMAYNASDVKIENTTITSSANFGIGLYGEDSTIMLADSEVEGNNIGAGITNCSSADFINTTFENNTIGFYLAETGEKKPVLKDCVFSGNSIAGAFVYDSVEIENTTFWKNGRGIPLENMGGLVVYGALSGDVKVNITASRFIQNKLGMTARGASLRITDSLFENNTLFNGTAGAVLGVGQNNSVFLSGCTFRRNPVGLEIHLQNSTASVMDSFFEANGVGVRIYGAFLTISGNDFEENDCGIEEHESRSTIELRNSFDSNTADYRYLVQMRFRVRDGYGIPLSGAEVTLIPSQSYRNFSQTFRTDSTGEAVGDVLVMERIGEEHSCFPYSVGARFRGIQTSETVSNEDNRTVELTLPFLRPEIVVKGLKVKAHGFSLFEVKPRMDEDSDIIFYVENTGKGRASNTTVMVIVNDEILEIRHITLESGEKRKLSVHWKPDHEGKINISVRAYDPDEPDPTAAGPEIGIKVGENQEGYFYWLVFLSVLAIVAMVWWIGRNIEGADEVMAEFTKKMRLRFADFLESIALRLKTQDAGYVEPESQDGIMPAGNIRAWEGQTLSGSGKFSPWSMDDIRSGRGREKDVVTVTIKIPPPEPEVVIEEPETETFEWVTTTGEKQKLKVDKKTLDKFTHPRLFICSRCDHSFVSTDRNAKCPWCGGNAILLKNL